MWLIVIGTSIWVLIDAKNIGVRKGLVSGLGNIGPWGWFFVTLLLWIVGFPAYLYYRGQFKQAVAAAANTPGETARPVDNSTALAELERLAALKERGLLTEEEFNAKKRQILGL